MIGGIEHGLTDSRFGHHRLNEAGAVTEDEEMNLAARSPVVQPPFDCDLFALVFPDILNVDVHAPLLSSANTSRFGRACQGQTSRPTLTPPAAARCALARPALSAGSPWLPHAPRFPAGARRR